MHIAVSALYRKLLTAQVPTFDVHIATTNNEAYVPVVMHDKKLQNESFFQESGDVEVM